MERVAWKRIPQLSRSGFVSGRTHSGRTPRCCYRFTLFGLRSLMLELAESLILAAGALPVYWMAKRHSQNQLAAIFACDRLLVQFSAAVPRYFD